ncbi:hypothetical protein HO173_002412 [Letharia columbiana]|uniref:Uncharacterized protein n=1 Tax=Letharia columbiana TaxID=112416 RepID=A0A8H6G3J8_9LECA|nr:uncharacterized protein HO173_002412 [Letharia columbiana]KAF6239865.1 hypothetical protein HO173_002412 [Letharia columbiana]
MSSFLLIKQFELFDLQFSNNPKRLNYEQLSVGGWKESSVWVSYLQIGRATPQAMMTKDRSPAPSILTTQTPSSNLPGTQDERRYFEYSRQRSVVEFSGYFRLELLGPVDFTEKFDVQRELIRPHAQTTVCRQDSIEQYNQALGHFRQNLGDNENRNVQSTLICCVLFIAFGTFLGNYDSGGLHLENGLKILHDWQVQQDQLLQSTHSSGTSMIEDDLLPVFFHLNLQATSLVDPGLSEHHRFIGDTATKSIPSAFSSLNQSRICLYNLFNATLDFIHSTYDIKEDPAVRRQALSLLSRLSLPRQEGTWNANDASKVGQWVIDVEEEGLGAVESAEDVPKSSHIQRIDAIAYMEERLVHVRCVLDDESESSEPDVEENTENQ